MSDSTCTFINLIKSFPCLWDIRSIDFNDKEICDNSIYSISEVMDMERNDVKTLFNNLQNTYIMKRKCCMADLTNGTNSSKTEATENKWKYYDELHCFLDEIVDAGENSNLPLADDSFIDIEVESSIDQLDNGTNQTMCLSIKSEPIDNDDIIESSQHISAETEQRKRTIDEENDMTFRNKYPKPVLPKRRKQNEDGPNGTSEYKGLTDFWSMQLCKLPEKEALNIINTVNNLLYKARSEFS